ncbi:MliC family protein [Luteimonas sp. WGS1318]|uniref:MliC family protein n=1 Tax=Luteimonas sp. WGS1318 TaxID=3366815 RepID=UPI00372CE94E
MRAAPAFTALFAALVLGACGNSPPATPEPVATANDTAAPPPAPPAERTEPEDAPMTGSLAAREAASEPSSTLNFDCEGVRITVAYENDDALAKFVVDGETLALDREDAPSGAMYADGAGNRFWAHRPDEARLTLDGDHERNCYRVY